METESPRDRVRQIREALGLKQGAFGKLLEQAARELGEEQKYDGSKVSKMENDKRGVSLEEVPFIAAVDPEHRGQVWLAWGKEGVEREEVYTHQRIAAKMPPPQGMTLEQFRAEQTRRAGKPQKKRGSA